MYNVMQMLRNGDKVVIIAALLVLRLSDMVAVAVSTSRSVAAVLLTSAVLATVVVVILAVTFNC